MMFSGSCPESDHCSGSHHADTLSATYQIQDGPCAGQSGVIQVIPVAADGINAPEVGTVYVGEVIFVDPADGNVVWLPVLEARQGQGPRLNCRASSVPPSKRNRRDDP